jgi:hypothetical protein
MELLLAYYTMFCLRSVRLFIAPHYGLDTKMYPEGLCVEGLVASTAMFRGGTFGKYVNNEDSDLTGVLIH